MNPIDKSVCIVEACVFYPKLPRSWIPDGLILVPCLSEKGVKGAFELDVYASGFTPTTPPSPPCHIFFLPIFTESEYNYRFFFKI